MTIEFDSLMLPTERPSPSKGLRQVRASAHPRAKSKARTRGRTCSFGLYRGSARWGRCWWPGNLDQPLSEEDMLRERVSNNVGEASDEQVSGLALTEHVVVTIPANTAIYVVLEKTASSRKPQEEPHWVVRSPRFGEHGSASSIVTAAARAAANGSGQRGEIAPLVEFSSFPQARIRGPILALSVQAARNQSVRGKLGRRLMRLTMDDQSCAEENHERSQAPGLAPEQEGCG